MPAIDQEMAHGLKAAKPLRLYEEIMLLAIHDVRRTLNATQTNIAVAAAVIVELTLLGRLDIIGRRRLVVEVLDSTPTGWPVLDTMLDRIASASRPESAKACIARLARTNDLRAMAAQQLVADGALGDQERSLLLFFTRATFPELDPTREAAIDERLRVAIFTDNGPVDERTALLVGLAQATKLLNRKFSRAQLKSRSPRIAQITSGDKASVAAKKALTAARVTAGALAGAGIFRALPSRIQERFQ